LINLAVQSSLTAASLLTPRSREEVLEFLERVAHVHGKMLEVRKAVARSREPKV
jgi:hypothetical protein